MTHPAPIRASDAEVEELQIERDPHDHSREYIPLPGGWEVQTKGAGSSYRLLDKKTGERHLILAGKDWQSLQAFFTRFAHEVFAASREERKALLARLDAVTRERDDLASALKRKSSGFRCRLNLSRHGQFGDRGR